VFVGAALPHRLPYYPIGELLDFDRTSVEADGVLRSSVRGWFTFTHCVPLGIGSMRQEPFTEISCLG
jgi:hypothetical protein